MNLEAVKEKYETLAKLCNTDADSFEKIMDGLSFTMIESLDEDTLIEIYNARKAEAEKKPKVEKNESIEEVSADALIDSMFENMQEEPTKYSEISEDKKVDTVLEKSIKVEKPVEPVKNEVPVEKNDDLFNIKIVDVPLHIIEDRFKSHISKNIDVTHHIVLPQSGYEAEVRGMKIDEIDAMKNSFSDDFLAQEKLRKIMYACISNTSIGNMSYDDFINRTSTDDIEIILFAIMKMTYGEITHFDIHCPHCQNVEKKTISMDRLIKIESENVIKLVNDIITSDPKEAINNSLLTKTTRVQLPKSKIILELQLASLAEEARVQRDFRNLPMEDKNTTVFTLLNIIKKAFIPNIEGDTGEVNGYVQYTQHKDIYFLLKDSLTKEDLNAIKDATIDFSKNRISFEIPSEKCTNPECGKEITNIKVEIIQNFLLETILDSIKV